ncbi:MAG: hypothetical protein ACI9GW_002938 [Halieaceae bacterium]|jgi:hypothetical protein
MTTGRCACGGVSYEICGPLRDVIACHCEQCRRTSGHFVAATATHRDNLTLRNQDCLKWYVAMHGYRRGFCDNCGSSLFFEKIGQPRISVAAGTLDSTVGLQLCAHIFTDEAGCYYDIGHAVPTSGGAEATPSFLASHYIAPHKFD